MSPAESAGPEHDPMIEILVIQILNLIRALARRHYTVVDSQRSRKFRLGVFLVPGALINPTLFVVCARRLGIVIYVQIKNLERLI